MIISRHFHTIEQEGNPTGPLTDLIVRDEDAGGEPRTWKYRCTLKARSACSAQPEEEAIMSSAAKTTFPAQGPNPSAFSDDMDKDVLYKMHDAMNETTEKKQKEQLLAYIKEYKGEREQ